MRVHLTRKEKKYSKEYCKEKISEWYNEAEKLLKEGEEYRLNINYIGLEYHDYLKNVRFELCRGHKTKHWELSYDKSKTPPKPIPLNTEKLYIKSLFIPISSIFPDPKNWDEYWSTFEKLYGEIHKDVLVNSDGSYRPSTFIRKNVWKRSKLKRTLDSFLESIYGPSVIVNDKPIIYSDYKFRFQMYIEF